MKLSSLLPLLLLLLLLLLSSSSVESADSGAAYQAAGIAYLRVVAASSSSAADASHENYCAYADPRLARNLSAAYRQSDGRQLVDLYPSNGCVRGNSSVVYSGRTVIVARGECSFSDKAVNAHLQGAVGLIVVSAERYPPYISVGSPLLPGNYPVAMVSKVAYQSFKSQFLASSGGATAALYRPVDDSSGSKQYMFLVLYVIALVAMVMSCVTAATGLRQYLLTRARLTRSSLNAENNAEMDSSSASWWQTAIFIAVLIAVPVAILLLLNFAYDYFVWVMLVLYGYAVASSLVYYINRMYLMKVQARLEAGPPRPWLATTVEWDLGKCCGKLAFSYLEFLAYPVCLSLALVWFVFRNAHWAFILTNLLNVVLVMRVIESLTFVLRIKMATILLACFLVYDVFFVFITPLFSGGGGGPEQPPTAAPSPTAAASPLVSRVRRDTVMDYYVERGGSIMERVALGTAGMSGEIIPIVFKVMSYPPAESVTTCLLPYSILGLGDVILPALLLSLNLFFDLAWSNRGWPYFLSALAGYLLGLGACAGVLFATGKGQPALLYIVPLILMTSYLCAAVRREAKLYFRTALPDEYRLVDGFEADGAGPPRNSASTVGGGGSADETASVLKATPPPVSSETSLG